MPPDSVRFETALVTGASSGLGEEFARQLARRCARLVLVARRRELIERLAGELHAADPRLEVVAVGADLRDPGQRLGLIEGLLVRGLVPELLVNNAGVGDYGEFASADWGRVESMLRLNIEALTHLTHALLPGMLQAGRGAILNVSSLAALVPMPDMAVYAASKAYVSSFTEALRIELRGHRIPVLAVCPGPVHTNFGQAAARRPDAAAKPWTPGWFRVPRQRVVARALAALDRNRARTFPGLKVAATAALIGLLPMAAIRTIMALRPQRCR